MLNLSSLLIQQTRFVKSIRSYQMNMRSISDVHLQLYLLPDENGKPGNDGRSYSEHFLEPFLAALEQIDVRPRIIDNYTSYANGEFAEKSRISIFVKKQMKFVR